MNAANTKTVYEVAPEMDDRIVLGRNEEGRIFDMETNTLALVSVWGTHEVKAVNMRAFVWDGATWRRA